MSQDMENRMDSLQARYKKLFAEAKIPFWDDESMIGLLFSLKAAFWGHEANTDKAYYPSRKIEESTIIMLLSVSRDEETGHIVPEWLIGEEVVKVYIPVEILHKLEMKK